MAKNIIINDGNYKISVDDTNSIILDVGATGVVQVTGDLQVDGTQTTVNSSTLEIQDNEIVVNKGETGYSVSVTGQEAGLRVERGQSADVRMVYDETITWNDPNTQTTSQGPGVGQQAGQGPNLGGFKLVDAGGTTISLKVANINNNNAIYFEPGGAGTLRVVRAGYEALLTDVNDIPNKKYVDTAISGAIIDKIITSNTKAEVTDTASGDPFSAFFVEIDGTEKFRIDGNLYTFSDIQVDDTTIRPNNSNASLFLETNGTGEVVVRDVLSIEGAVAPGAPSADSGRIKLYSQAESTGGSGLYFVNTSSTRDELVSKKKALLYSMLF